MIKKITQKTTDFKEDQKRISSRFHHFSSQTRALQVYRSLFIELFSYKTDFIFVFYIPKNGILDILKFKKEVKKTGKLLNLFRVIIYLKM